LSASRNDTEEIIRGIITDWGLEILESTVLLKYEDLKKDLSIIIGQETSKTGKSIQLAKSLLSLSPLNCSAMTAISKRVASDEFIKDNFIIDSEESKFSDETQDAMNNLIFRMCNSFERASAISEDEQLMKVVSLTISGVYKKDLIAKFQYVESRNQNPVKYKILYPVLLVSIYKNLLTNLALSVVEKYFKLERQDVGK
jgi:hypothetical protein